MTRCRSPGWRSATTRARPKSYTIWRSSAGLPPPRHRPRQGRRQARHHSTRPERQQEPLQHRRRCRRRRHHRRDAAEDADGRVRGLVEQASGQGETADGGMRVSANERNNRHFRDYPVTEHAADMPKSTRMPHIGHSIPFARSLRIKAKRT
jgi:hypothetical protein